MLFESLIMIFQSLVIFRLSKFTFMEENFHVRQVIILHTTIDFLLETKGLAKEFVEVKVNGTMASYIFIFPI